MSSAGCLGKHEPTTHTVSICCGLADGLLSPRQLPTQPSSSLKWTKAETNLSALPPPTTSESQQQLQTQQSSSYNQVMQVDPVLYELTLAKDRLQMLEHEIKLDGDEAPISILGFKAGG